MALRDWIFGKRSLLREIAGSPDPTALLNAAMLIHRAGLQHLVNGAGEAEVIVMARAGEIVQKERVAMFFFAYHNTGEFLEPFDNGQFRDTQVLNDMERTRDGR